MSQVRFTLSRRQAAALIEMASHGQGAVRRALADDVLARVGRRAAMHAVKPLEDHDLGPSLSERMAEVTAPVRVPPEPTPLDRERKTLNTLWCLAGQVEGYLETASDPTCPASLVAQRRRVLRATLHAAQHVARAAERTLSVTPEAIDREMARARRPDQPLPSHAATLNGAGEGVTLQPGADAQ